MTWAFLTAPLESEPDAFEAAAVAWHERWCAELPGIRFADAHAVLSALEALSGPDPIPACRALHTRSRRHGSTR